MTLPTRRQPLKPLKKAAGTQAQPQPRKGSRGKPEGQEPQLAAVPDPAPHPEPEEHESLVEKVAKKVKGKK